MLASWWSTAPHDTRRSVALVRVAVAVLLLAHPLHALLHPADAQLLAADFAAHGAPLGVAGAWIWLAATLVCALGLLVRRVVVPAAIGAAALVAADLLVLHGRHWFVLGGYAVDGEPGAEYGVLLLACLAGVVWTARGFTVIYVVSAAILLPHALGPFLFRDVEGMRGWGQAMEHLGFPCGVALVWSIKALEAVSCAGRLSRRLVVPACAGHLLILVPGMWISQEWNWFIYGPGEGGIEYPVLLSICAIAAALAYSPYAFRKKSATSANLASRYARTSPPTP